MFYTHFRTNWVLTLFASANFFRFDAGTFSGASLYFLRIDSSLINDLAMASLLNKTLVPRITRLPRARGNITGFSWAKKIPHDVNHAGFNLA